MEYQLFDNRFVVRLVRGEEILDSLRKFCHKEGIRAGSIMGIGALSAARISYYDPEKGEYLHRDFSGDREITSLSGNISTTENEIFLHLHVTLADQEFNVIGGHLTSGVVGATGEVVIDPIKDKLERSPVNESGLRLLSLKDGGNEI
jgi:predicted DNA-binding protein with PD1-like motif